MKRLAVVTTHPIQYNAPLFAQLAKYPQIDLCVFYTLGNTAKGYYDEKFGREIQWDIPLLNGYKYVFVENKASKPSSKKFFGIRNRQLIDKIEEFDPDAILIYGWRHYSHLQTMIHFKGKIPILFRGDSTLIDIQSNWKLWTKTFFLKQIYRHIDFALYVGENNRKYFQQCGLRSNQLWFVPHAVDNKRFADNNFLYTAKAEELRQKIGIAPDDNVVLFVGKFETKKNPQILVQAAEVLKDLKFVFVGNGHLENHLFSHKPNNVIHIPFQNQSQMPIIYRLGDVLVLPSIYNETWGLVVNEAMACGLPVVVSDKVGCAADLVKQDYNGYVFEAQNLDDMVSKILLTLKQKQQMSANSLLLIQEYSYNKATDQIHKLLSQL